MKFRSRYTWTALIAVTIPLDCRVTFGGSNGISPHSWTATSSNGEYVFAGVPPYSLDKQFEMSSVYSTEAERAEYKGIAASILKRYPVSGMYKNDGTGSLLWSHNEWLDHGMPINDGKHLVVIGQAGYGNDTRSDIATIYGRQGMVGEIELSDVVPFWEQAIRRWFSGRYATCNHVALSTSGGELVVTTDLGDMLEIAVKDGSTLRRESLHNTLRAVVSGWRGRAFLLAIAGVFVIVGRLLFIWANRRGLKPT